MVPEDGLEPSRYLYRWILSPLRLPFHHSGICLYIIHNLFLKINEHRKDYVRICYNGLMNEHALWDEYITAHGSTRLIAFSKLLQLAASEQLNDRWIIFLFDNLELDSQAHVLTSIHMLSKQAIFQSMHYDSEKLIKCFHKALKFKPIFLYQLLDSVPGFVAHHQISTQVISFILIVLNHAHQESNETLKEVALKTIYAIKQSHPSAKGIEKIKKL